MFYKIVPLSLKQFISSHFHNNDARFVIAQLLFIFSVTFGWYIEDGYRRGAFLLALVFVGPRLLTAGRLCTYNAFSFFLKILMIAFALWVLVIPLLFGEATLQSRVLSLARPFEVILFICGMLYFANSKTFINRFCLMSLLSSSIFVICILYIRTQASFAPIYDGWALRMHAAIGGMTVCMTASWLIYYVCSNKTQGTLKLWCFIMTAGAALAVISTYYLTVWLAFCSQLLWTLLLILFYFKSKKLLLLAACLSIIFAAIFACMYQKSPWVKVNVEQLLQINKNTDNFTNQRVGIWQEAYTLILRHPLTGYGWVDYNDFASIKKHHPHSSYLQAAFIAGIPCMIMYVLILGISTVLALMNLFRRRGPQSISFVIILMLAAYSIGGLGEAYFFVRREFLIPFWCTLSLLLSPLYCIKETNE